MSFAADDPARAALVRLVRDEGRRVLATLIRLTGNLELAEDAVQDATLRALQTWPDGGVPAQPRAWLTMAARRRAIDLMRREGARVGKEASAMELLDQPGDDPPEVVRDDLLRLIFVCCHPSLDQATQLALALRNLCGLSTAEVGRALLVPEATMAKRLTRARQKIARAAIPYRVPAAHELPDRLRGVVGTLYLMFNEGYGAVGAPKPALVDEAIRLTRLLAELMPGEPPVLGLLALQVLLDSRRDTRHDAAGRPVLLADQDRSRWRRPLIAEGVALTSEGLRRSPQRPDPYVVQAAIAACHAIAANHRETDWAAVVSWYDVLLSVLDTPVVRLNRAVAVGERSGPAAALVDVEAITELGTYPLWHATRGELLARLGRVDHAAAAYATAITLAPAGEQRDHLRSRAAGLPR